PTDDIIRGWQQIDGKWYYFNSDGSWDSSK
ncbi:hypothetical protein CN677_30715, partial [Bacillus pseudomycoides]